MNFPSRIPELQKELLEHAKAGRSDALFRFAIAIDQVGSLVRHHTHDQKENPSARPHGTPKSEVSDAGHAIVQLMTYCALRGIDLQEAINTALVNLREKDFIKRESAHGELITGQTGMVGIRKGTAFVCEPEELKSYRAIPLFSILVTSHLTSDVRLGKFIGVVTDHGGSNCHAAIIAREFGIPCVVGTGDATKRIKTGDNIEINCSIDQGQVKII